MFRSAVSNLNVFRLLAVFSLMLFSGLSGASAASTSSVLSLKDYLSLEGAYSIDAEYTHFLGTNKSRLDQLILYKNIKKDSYTLSLSTELLELPFILFKEVKVVSVGEKIELRGEGELDFGIYGEIHLFIDPVSKELEGFFTDSLANGYKEFVGQIDYGLSGCLYTPEDSRFVFPSIAELVGEYVHESGHVLVIRTYTSGAISMVLKIKLHDGDFANAPFKNGVYTQELGLLEFPWTSRDGMPGKANVTYRLDAEGVPYLKMFSMGTSGQSRIRKFYFQRPILDLP